MTKEIFEQSSALRERGIELGPIESCAMGQAFKHNPDVIKDLEAIVGAEKISAYRGIFEGEYFTQQHVGFMPTQDIKTVYSFLADAEKQRLNEPEVSLDCDHDSAQHITALDHVLSQLKNITPPQPFGKKDSPN